jgi:hypothetical protein
MEAEVDTQMRPAPTLDQMANSVARHFGRVFARQVVWVETLEDLLPDALPDCNTAVTV